METLKTLKGSPLGLYDNNSTEETSVVADKVIDVTSMCPESRQCVIKYANVTRGRIAQICDFYEKGKDLGVCVHYHINEMTPVELAEDVVFASSAKMMGANNYDLAKIIFDNQ